MRRQAVVVSLVPPPVRAAVRPALLWGGVCLLAAGVAMANPPPPPPSTPAAPNPDVSAKPAPISKSARQPLHAPAAPAPAAAPVAAAAAPAHDNADTLAVLKGRLEEKLGATKAPHGSANVLRVANKAPAGAASGEMVLHGAAGGAAAAHAAPAHRRVAKTRGHGAAAASAHGAANSHAAHWDYRGSAGPEAWGAMKPEFATCSIGTRQSPIDIRDGLKVQLDPVQFDYRATGFSVIDNGHTIQVNVQPGNSIEANGRRYDLLQFHFHRPSEERINGKQFDMVAHLVHKDAEGRLAVVAVLLDRGAAQPLIQQVWNNLPLEKNEAVPARVAIDLNALLPAERSYFTYMGSLTTPPCSEGVLWMVMKTPVGVSNDQISLFSRLYPMNARPIQQVAGRMIKESN